ncbi:hypothetical protein FQN50_009822 [Emmonsiellopsis sp. PD_5]|nr:hypothetical protein FQN50_009822 [Emmonsiellopsis sp. PD_5]
MVCSKCQRKLKKTELATPAVKRKNDMYYGSPSSTVGGGGDTKSRSSSATLGNTGISKNKLLSNKAKNPYAAYSSSCESCKAKTEQGRKFCQRLRNVRQEPNCRGDGHEGGLEEDPARRTGAEV